MKIRPFHQSDLSEVHAIETQVWGDTAATTEAILSRATHCPEGSIVAELDGHIVGYAAAQTVSHISTGTWAEQTDNGLIARTHVPDGKIAYGVNMSALPMAARTGLSGQVIEHYRQIFLGTGRCNIMVLGSRLPGFAKWQNTHAAKHPIAEYLKPGADGRYIDPELRLYQKGGFHVLWGLPGYFPDCASDNAGAMIFRTH